MTTFLGYKRINFKTEEGEQIVGYNLYFAEEDMNAVGFVSFKQFLNDDTFAALNKIHDLKKCVSLACEPTYNRFKKIISIDFI